LEAFEHFKAFYNSVTTLHSRPIKNITTDGRGEFNSNKFKEFLKLKGVTSNITSLYTPQQNPAAEWGNCTTNKKACALLKQAKLPHCMWGHAVQTAVFLLKMSLQLRRMPGSQHTNYGFAVLLTTCGSVRLGVERSLTSPSPSKDQNFLTRQRRALG
jgi:hypothetical protein